MSCRSHGYPWPSLATSPYHSSLLAGLQGYIPYPHIAAVCMFKLVVLLWLGHMRGSIGVHHWWVLQQCPACMVRLACIVFETGGSWPYSWCLVKCCHQDYIYIGKGVAPFPTPQCSSYWKGAFWSQHSCVIAFLVATFLCNCRQAFSSTILLASQVVHPYSSIDTTAAWKKLLFILSVRSDFHIIESLSIAVHVFVSRVSMSFSIDETLLPR